MAERCSCVESPFIHFQRMDSNRPMLLSGAILFAMGLVIGIAIGSATAVSALTQGAPDVLQSWSGVVAMP